MPRRRSSQVGSKKGDFAAAVMKLYRAALNDGRLPAGGDDLDVRRVAFGLAAIQQLIHREIAKAVEAPFDEVVATGVADALALLEALVTGLSHPIHRYVTDLHSEQFRPNAAPPNALENLGRAIVVGTILALRALDARSAAAARRLVCQALSGDRVLTEESVKGWERSFNQKRDPWPIALRDRLLDHARRAADKGADPEEVILADAQRAVLQFWVTPRLRTR